MATVILSRGEIAVVDEEDLALVSQKSWYAAYGPSGNVYAEARHGKGHIRMHTLITGQYSIDHIDNDGLNNRRSNLRPATQSQNGMNRNKVRGTSSKFKGVGWHKKTRCWRAYIKRDGMTKSLGYYKDEIEAAKAYDKAALELFGEYAKLNFSR